MPHSDVTSKRHLNSGHVTGTDIDRISLGLFLISSFIQQISHVTRMTNGKYNSSVSSLKIRSRTEDAKTNQVIPPWHMSKVCFEVINYRIVVELINPLNSELNPICYLLALFGAHHILHVSGIRVN